MANEKVKIARLSVFSNTFLIIIKLIAGILSGSVSIISEAIHSFMDLLAAIIAFFSVRVSDNPPDDKHPYGHGKFENISGVIEGLLIILAAGWIIYEAVMKFFHDSEIEAIGIGSAVMLLSAGVNYLVSLKLYKVAKETDSIALEADALHLKTDVLTSAGVGVGLLLIWITGYKLLDPIVAILVALLILKEAIELIKNAYSPLVDSSLSSDEKQTIEKVISLHGFHFHDLRTRKAGNQRFADLHLELNHNLSLKEVHDICDKLEDEIQQKIQNIHITIHAEPIVN